MKMKVLNVDRLMVGEKPCWQVKYEVTEAPEQQPIFYHIFPDDQISFMMAAYDVDDVDEVVDMILADPFLDEDPGPALYSGRPAEDIRTEHRSRCARGKLKSKLSSRGIENPVEMIRSSVVVDKEAIKARRKEIRETRQQVQSLKGKNRG